MANGEGLTGLDMLFSLIDVVKGSQSALSGLLGLSNKGIGRRVSFSTEELKVFTSGYYKYIRHIRKLNGSRLICLKFYK